MRIILGKNYINEKEAAQRYGFSESWFRRRRHENKEPIYHKVEGKVLYDVNEIDDWFKYKLEEEFI